MLLPNPTSIFADDVQFESTLGTIDYDVGRIHSGHLEGEYHVDGNIDLDMINGGLRIMINHLKYWQRTYFTN